MSTVDRNQVVRHFDIEAYSERYGNGHINDTYRVHTDEFILQRINTDIFKDPDALMENIRNVTAYLRERIEENGGDPDRETLTVIPTLDGKNYYRDEEQNCFRMYRFINGTVTVESKPTPGILSEAGKGFGRFQNLLDGFPVERLHETIADFHHTPKRLEAFRQAVSKDAAGRVKEAEKEIEFVLSRAPFADTVVKGLEDGSVPMRLTHNDTKINNILFDQDTLEAVCVIDLDTVMPGSALYDFGDTLRIGASTAAEDEAELSRVEFDTEAFRCFAEGYCREVGDRLTKREWELLSFAPKLMTYECGVRFLTDYLSGDTYFKIHRDRHNLDRARNQFRLVSDMEEKEDTMERIIREIHEKRGSGAR